MAFEQTPRAGYEAHANFRGHRRVNYTAEARSRRRCGAGDIFHEVASIRGNLRLPVCV